MLAALIAAGAYLTRLDFVTPVDVPPMKATEEQAKKDRPMTGEEFSRAMAAQLGRVSELESARKAFNVLAGAWNVPPVPETPELDPSNGMESAALDRGLRLYRFSGNLGALLRVDYPAVLELSLPGVPGKRFVSLVGMEEEQLLIDPPIEGRKSLSFSEIEKYWSGRALFLWKDFLNLVKNVSPGSKGDRIKEVQGLLKEAGAYGKPLTGIYNADTVSAVRELQASKGIEQDGIAGGHTLMFLYRDIDRFQVPRLTKGRK
jgi:general secretion pathway protein A